MRFSSFVLLVLPLCLVLFPLSCMPSFCSRKSGAAFTAIYEKVPEDAKLAASVNAGNPKKLKAAGFRARIWPKGPSWLGKLSLRKSTDPKKLIMFNNRESFTDPFMKVMFIIPIYPNVMGHCPSGWWWHHQRPVCAGALDTGQASAMIGR